MAKYAASTKKISCAKECQVRTPDKGDAAAFHDVWGLWSTGNPICGGRRQFLLSEMCSGQRARKALVLCLITGIIVRKPYLNYSDAMITMITSATLPDVSSLELERIFFFDLGSKIDFFSILGSKIDFWCKKESIFSSFLFRKISIFFSIFGQKIDFRGFF